MGAGSGDRLPKFEFKAVVNGGFSFSRDVGMARGLNSNLLSRRDSFLSFFNSFYGLALLELGVRLFFFLPSSILCFKSASEEKEVLGDRLSLPMFDKGFPGRLPRALDRLLFGLDWILAGLAESSGPLLEVREGLLLPNPTPT